MGGGIDSPHEDAVFEDPASPESRKRRISPITRPAGKSGCGRRVMKAMSFRYGTEFFEHGAGSFSAVPIQADKESGSLVPSSSSDAPARGHARLLKANYRYLMTQKRFNCRSYPETAFRPWRKPDDRER
ncbi:MAG: hypothetical protein V1792_00275 [Pseudomonadota bacterium]